MTPAEFAQRFLHPALEADDDVIEVGDADDGYVTAELSDGSLFEITIERVR